MPETDLSRLGDRLRVLRADALRQLGNADRVDGGLLALAAHINAVLATLDATAVEAAPPVLGDRALVLDDNVQIMVVIYSAGRQAVAATLSPVAAIRLGNELVAAGVRRL